MTAKEKHEIRARAINKDIDEMRETVKEFAEYMEKLRKQSKN